jgi:hypothetical protein
MSKHKVSRFILAAASLILPTISNAAPSDDMLKALVDKARMDSADYSEAKVLRDQLKAAYPSSDQAAVGDAVYAWFLAGQSKPRKVAEIRGLFEELKAKGESKWYVVYARMALAAAYGHEGLNAQSKAVAQQAIQTINVEELKQSYVALLPILKAAFGEDQFTGGSGDMDEWMASFQAIAASD